MDTILKQLDAGLSVSKVLWNGVLLAMTPVIQMYNNITTSLQGLAGALSFANQFLEAGISAANRARAAAGAPVVVPSVSTGSTGGRTGRAWGGEMFAGQPYNIMERGSKSEVFVPNVSGKMETQMKVTLTDRDLQKIGNASGHSTARALAPLIQRRMPA